MLSCVAVQGAHADMQHLPQELSYPQRVSQGNPALDPRVYNRMPRSDLSQAAPSHHLPGYDSAGSFQAGPWQVAGLPQGGAGGYPQPPSRQMQTLPPSPRPRAGVRIPQQTAYVQPNAQPYSRDYPPDSRYPPQADPSSHSYQNLPGSARQQFGSQQLHAPRPPQGLQGASGQSPAASSAPRPPQGPSYHEGYLPGMGQAFYPNNGPAGLILPEDTLRAFAASQSTPVLSGREFQGQDHNQFRQQLPSQDDPQRARPQTAAEQSEPVQNGEFFSQSLPYPTLGVEVHPQSFQIFST